MFFMIAFSLEICYNNTKFDKSIYAYRRGAQPMVAFLGAIFRLSAALDRGSQDCASCTAQGTMPLDSSFTITLLLSVNER